MNESDLDDEIESLRIAIQDRYKQIHGMNRRLEELGCEWEEERSHEIIIGD